MPKDSEAGVSRRGLFRLIAGRDPDPGPAQSEASAWRETAREAFSQGDFQTAADHFRAWLRHCPDDDDARLLLGRALYAMGRHVQALVEFDRVSRRHEAHTAGFFLCLCRLRLGKADKALDAFQAGAGLDPDMAEALAARIEAARGDPARAAEAADALEIALSRTMQARPETVPAMPRPGGGLT